MKTADISVLMHNAMPRLADVLARFSTDASLVSRRHSLCESSACRAAQRLFLDEWRAQLGRVDFNALDTAGRVDLLLLDRRICARLDQLAREGLPRHYLLSTGTNGFLPGPL